MLFAAIFLFMLSPDARAEAGAPDYAAMSLDELCERYDDISGRLATEYIDTRTGAAEALGEAEGDESLSEEELAERRKAFYNQVQKQVKYNETRAELKAVVKELGIRECPDKPMEFEPLIQDT